MTEEVNPRKRKDYHECSERQQRYTKVQIVSKLEEFNRELRALGKF
jgi:hypothetical protein